MATLFDYLDAPAKPTQSSPKAAKGWGDPSKEQIFGRNDLASYIQQSKDVLRDAVPGSELHKRTMGEISIAEKEFSRMGGQPAQQTPQPASPQTAHQGGTFADYLDEPVSAKTKPTIQATAEKPGIVQQTLQTALNLKNQAPGFVASALDTVANLPSAVVGTIGYGAGRLFGLSPEEATAASQKTAQPLSNPIGRATGLAGTPEYQNAAPTQLNELIGSYAHKGAEAVGKATGANPTDIEQGVTAAMMGLPFVKAPIGRGINAVKAALPEYTTQVAGAPSAVVPRTGMNQSIGAAAAGNEARLAELHASASPEMKAAIESHVAQKAPITATDLKSIENHNNFNEFGMKATPGEMTQNINLLSDEYNSIKSNPQMAAALQERDPKLIAGFNKIKEDFAPESYSVDQPSRANTALTALKEKYDVREANINKKYQALRDANGGEFPIDGKTFADNAIVKLHKDLSYEATPPILLKALDRFANGEKMTFEQFERIRTITAAEMRKGGNESHAASLVRQALEDLPLTGDAAATLKPLANAARNAAREQKQLTDSKSPKYNAAYTAAANDTRSAAEIAQGVPHPASNAFFDKHVVGRGTSEMQLRRAIDELSGNQAALDELRAGVIHEAKAKSGIKNDAGAVSQAALSDFINKQMAGKLDVALGPEASAKLRRLSDVATKSEHVRKGGYANTSKTAIAQTPSPIGSGLKTLGGMAVNVGIGAASPATGAALAVAKTLSKPFFEKRALAKEAAALEKANLESVNPSKGLGYLSDIGKK